MLRTLDPKFRAALSLLQIQELEQTDPICVGCGCDDAIPVTMASRLAPGRLSTSSPVRGSARPA
jgi:hypothetical protein